MQDAVDQVERTVGARRDIRIVSDDDEARAGAAVELEHQVEHLLGAVAVEIARRLVGKDGRGRGDERPRQRHALAFASRKLARPMQDPLGQAHPLEQRGRLRPRLVLRVAPDEKRHCHVVERGEFRQQMMVVTDKQADIAILRTQGASPASILAIFVIQGALVGTVGTLLGVAGGLALAINIETVVPFVEQLLGVQFLDKSVYYISELPSEVQRADVILIAAIALALTLLATLYPSWRAARVNPAEALRYE